MKFIEYYSEFVLNETLKTIDIDIAIDDIKLNLYKHKYHFTIEKHLNKIQLTLNNVNKINMFSNKMELLNDFIINTYGWFPSIVMAFNLSEMPNEFAYDLDKLIKSQRNLSKIRIEFEPKYDVIISNIPSKLYHLSIQEYQTNIIKIGLCPKSKNKLSKHLDRIYLCSNSKDCKQLNTDKKNKMPIKYSENTKWIIYEIDTNNLNIVLYQDPNYKHGFYCINNIPPNKIKIYDKEL